MKTDNLMNKSVLLFFIWKIACFHIIDVLGYGNMNLLAKIEVFS